MLIVKAKHGKRRYIGRGIISNILNSPIAQKLAVAAITGAAKGLVRKRQQEQDQIPRKKAYRLINGTGIILE